jgi:hypothetical protein
VQPASIAHLQRTDPEEWARQFRAWTDSHRPDIPVLSHLPGSDLAPRHRYQHAAPKPAAVS